MQESQTQIFTKAEEKYSRLFGVSIRAWIALLLVSTVCIMSLAATKVDEPLYSGFLIVLGFYMGSKTQTTKQQ